MNRVLIYSSQDSPRLRYVLDLFFRQTLGLYNWKLTQQRADFLAATATAKLNYSSEHLPNIPQLLPQGFLFETALTPVHPQPQNYRGRTAAFFVALEDFPKEILYPFDLLSWSFYLVSRYEEYLPFETDDWGRFRARQSLAFQQGFLQRPLVNEWILDFAEQLQQFYPSLQFNPRPYRFTPSYDIDHAYAFAHKPLWRQAAAWARNVWQNAKAYNCAVLPDATPLQILTTSMLIYGSWPSSTTMSRFFSGY